MLARPVCRHHMEGNCTYGSQCRFSHSCFLDRRWIHKPGKFGKDSRSPSHYIWKSTGIMQRTKCRLGFSSFLLFAAHVSGRETKSIELWQTHAGFYCPIGRGHVPRAIFDCQTMTSVVEILIHWVLFHAQRRIYVFRDYIPGQQFVVGRKFSLAALDIVKFQPFSLHLL